jgi:hypothetical protein
MSQKANLTRRRASKRARSTVASKSAPGQPMKSRTIRLNLSGFSMNMK